MVTSNFTDYSSSVNFDNIYTEKEIENERLALVAPPIAPPEETETNKTEYSFSAPSDIFTVNPKNIGQIQGRTGSYRGDLETLGEVDRVWLNSNAQLPEFNETSQIASEENIGKKIGEKIADVNNRIKSFEFNETTNITNLTASKKELDELKETVKEVEQAAYEQRFNLNDMAVIKKAKHQIQKLENQFKNTAENLLKSEEYNEEDKAELRKLLQEETNSSEEIAKGDTAGNTNPNSNGTAGEFAPQKITFYQPQKGGINSDGNPNQTRFGVAPTYLDTVARKANQLHAQGKSPEEINNYLGQKLRFTVAMDRKVTDDNPGNPKSRARTPVKIKVWLPEKTLIGSGFNPSLAKLMSKEGLPATVGDSGGGLLPGGQQMDIAIGNRVSLGSLDGGGLITNGRVRVGVENTRDLERFYKYF